MTATLEVMPDSTSFPFRVDPFTRTKSKVAIVGFTDHRIDALNLPEDEFELWGLNELYRFMELKRFHRWFEIHQRSDFEKDDEGLKHLTDMGKDFDIPIYMHDHHDDIPASVPFPKKLIEETLESTYFTSSPAWMIGMAICMEFEEIHVYGVDLAQDTEYFEQRPCVEHWLGVAKGMGIKTYLPPTSDVLKAIGQYGFGSEGSLLTQKLQERLAWLHRQDNDRLALIRKLDAEYNDKRTRIEADRNQIVGAINNCNYFLRSWSVAASDGKAVPDRSEDPRTGITAEE